MNKQRKSTGILTAALAAVVAVIGIVLMSCAAKKTTVTTVTDATLMDALTIGELSTCEFYYNGVATVKDGKKEYLAKYDAVVKAGVNTKDIRFQIDNENKTIHPVLPQISINDVIVTDGSLSLMPDDTNANLKDVITACKEDAVNEANVNEKFLASAEVNLKNTVIAFLTPIADSNGYSIVW